MDDAILKINSNIVDCAKRTALQKQRCIVIDYCNHKIAGLINDAFLNNINTSVDEVS
jgi:hypothetical protein